MKRNRWLRGIVGVLAVALFISGCGKKDSSSAVDGDSLSVELKNYVYKSEEINGIGSEGNEQFIVTDDRVYLLTYDYKYDEDVKEPEPRTFKEGEEIEEADGVETEEAVETEGTEALEEGNEVAIDEEAEAGTEADTEEKRVAADSIIIDDGFIDDGEVHGNGTVILGIRCVDYDGKELFNSSKEYAGNISFVNVVAGENCLYYLLDEYDENEGKEKFSLVCVDDNGNEKWISDVQSPASQDVYFYPSSMVVVDNGIVIVSTVGTEFFSTDGKSNGLKTAAKSNESMGFVIKLKNGKYVVSVYSEENPQLYEIDINSGAIGAKVEIPFSIYNYNTFVAGTVHDIILTDSSGVYYYNIGDSEVHKMLDFGASDLCISYINNVFEKDENTLVGLYYDEYDEKNHIAVFRKVAPEQVAERKNISIGAMYVSSAIRKRVIDFNRSNSEYRIVMINYSDKYGDIDWQEKLKKINNEIATGKTPDIMLCDNSLNIDTYVSKGVFMPLNSFFDNDPDIKREDYLENILDALSYDGKMYYITPSFQIRTLVGKKSLLGDKTSWTMDDLVKLADSMGEGKQVFDLMTKADFVNNYMYYNTNEFIDKNTGKASFDSDEFIKVLKFTERLPLEIDYEKFDDDFWNSYQTMFRDGRAAVQMYTIYDFVEAYNNEQANFGEPVSYVGFPCENGNGNSISYDYAIAISAKTKYKDAAWQFVKETILDDAQDNLDYMIPIKKSAIQKKIDNALKPVSYTDEKGVEHEEPASVWIGDKEIKVDPPKQADIDRYMDVIKSASSVSNYSEDIINIIKEDAESFYNGQKSAEEVAKTIQNRVQVYVNETR